MSERITGVALLSEDGRMWSLPKPARHYHLYALAAFQGADPLPCEEGFTNGAGRFLTRSEAKQAVIVTCQPMRQA